MKMSGASIVKQYLQKYISINLIKTRQQQYKDQTLARITLALAYDIVHEMDSLIRTNNANDFEAIKRFLKERINCVHSEVRSRQKIFDFLFREAKLPNDFGRCVKEAWQELQDYERHNQPQVPNRMSNFTPLR